MTTTVQERNEIDGWMDVCVCTLIYLGESTGRSADLPGDSVRIKNIPLSLVYISVRNFSLLRLMG